MNSLFYGILERVQITNEEDEKNFQWMWICILLGAGSELRSCCNNDNAHMTLADCCVTWNCFRRQEVKTETVH